ncbi:hypothetical protein YC2023_107836 [Brassica napus]
MIEMHRKKYDWKAGEASENEMEEEIESTHVSAATKRKNKFQDTGAESRKKRLLCQRSTEKIENLTRGEVLSSQTAHAAPASYPSHFATPASTGDAGATPASTGDAGATPASTHALASDSTRARAPTANPASTHTSAPATSHRRAPAPSCSGAPTLSHTCGPASSAKIRSQTKCEMVRVEHEMSKKLKEKVDLEIARVAQEMKQKLKIAMVAMVVVGAIVGIWTSLTV